MTLQKFKRRVNRRGKANSANKDQTEGLRQPTMSKLNRMETMMKMMLVIGAKPFKIKTNV